MYTYTHTPPHTHTGKMYVHVNASACRGQKRELGTLELELKAVVSSLIVDAGN